MFSFFSKQKFAFGLDISDTTVRLMRLEPSGNGWFPAAFAEARVPKGMVVDSKIVQPDALANLVIQQIKNPAFGKFDSDFVVMAVPEAKSFVRVISVPRMTEAEAVEAVPLEAEQYIPLPSENVYLDYKFLPSLASGRSGERQAEGEKMKVLIMASPKNYIDDYLDLAKRIKLRPVAIEVESEAIARALVPNNQRGSALLIVDIGATHTSLIIHDQGILQFTSSLPVAGESLTSQIAQQLTINPEDAEKLKRQHGLAQTRDGERVRAALKPMFSSLIEAIENTIAFYREHSESGRTIGEVVICGGGGKLKGLPEYLSDAVHHHTGTESIPVHLGDPWVNVLEKPIKRVPPIPKADAIGFTTAIGLALRGVHME